MKYRATADTTAPPDRVWSALIDVESWPTWMTSYTSVDRLEPGPLVVGSTADVRQPGLKKAVFRVTHLEPGVEFTWTTSAPGVRTTGRHVVAPSVGGGTEIALELEQQGILAPLVRLALARKIRSYLEVEAAGLCRAAEAGAQH